ncbi:putative protein phosphatase 2C [Gregarina niphandrodes]|uniref:PPM-type phosphatase domain-containing protein n=1 Tax=Gregarina niphandrodes TaxID=110365 RepID=A0A023BAW2_GRENI|nr:putative protein phosphatase 2C [Gregarina niphandrodes]EZG78817.1 putative protein phosphatase 2C [Gregarina niphandrodes]|eukprot:XP_011129184.1 putative protein phosphatase 2C [Gregarina niphandrodes]
MGACASRDGQLVQNASRTIAELPRPAADQPMESKDIWFDEEEPSTQPSPTAPTPTPNGNRRRRRLSVSTVDQPSEKKRTATVKYEDPVRELIDKNRRGLREVTLQMLKELFPAAEHYAVFGSPSYSVQRGFDNKVTEIDGGMPPGRTLKDIGVGYACKKGLKPESPNQDDYYVLKVDDWSMYGVFDGHGPHGHHISAFVHKTLPFLIISDPEFESDLEATLIRAFKKVHQLVVAVSDLQGMFDCSLSGTTATVAVQRDGKLTVAHVGDSTAVLAKHARADTHGRHTPSDGRPTDADFRTDFRAEKLTNDHKPMLPAEKARIEAKGGEVRRLEGDIPHRVFVKHRMYPGLAMSRALGDSVAASVGVSHEPEVRTYDLSTQDFFVIATDGVWEFIDGQQAVDIIAAFPSNKVDEAAEALAYESWKRWVEEEDNVVDDVTCIVVWT